MFVTYRQSQWPLVSQLDPCISARGPGYQQYCYWIYRSSWEINLGNWDILSKCQLWSFTRPHVPAITVTIPAQSNATHDAHRWQREEDGSPLILFSFHQECEARCHNDWFNGTLNVIYNHSLIEWVMCVDCIEKVHWFYFTHLCSKNIFRSFFLSLKADCTSN